MFFENTRCSVSNQNVLAPGYCTSRLSVNPSLTFHKKFFLFASEKDDKFSCFCLSLKHLLEMTCFTT